MTSLPIHRLAEIAIVVLLLSHVAIAGDRPNFIIVVTDDQGWGDAACYGHKTLKTPHLDAMASNGIRFKRFYAAASMCSPTRATILTGRNNLRMGISGPLAVGESHLPAEEITIAEAIKSKGYVSGHFGKWHLGDIINESSSHNMMHPGMAGFDEWFSSQNVLPTFDPYTGKFGKEAHYFHNGRYVPESEGITGDDSKIVMDVTLRFVREQAKQEKPFFAFVCFHAVHRPMGLIPQHAEPYATIHDKNEKIYYSNITSIDAQLGRLRKELRELDVAENTMLWFCSDNGPNLKGEEELGPGLKGPYRGSKGTLYEGGIRVPGVLEWPARISSARVSTVPVVTSDFFPTCLDVLGIPLPKCPYDGISLLDIIDGKSKRRNSEIYFSCKGWLAVQTEQHKLIHPSARHGSGRLELYDLLTDPHEETNLIVEQPELAAMLSAKLDRWVAACEASQAGEDYQPDNERTTVQ